MENYKTYLEVDKRDLIILAQSLITMNMQASPETLGHFIGEKEYHRFYDMMMSDNASELSADEQMQIMHNLFSKLLRGLGLRL